MSERAPYSRVYWSVMDDPKFDGIYEDDAAFALWMRLLMNADALWPAPAPLHRTAKPKALAKLVDAGIVDLLPRDRYRIHGLDAERGRRRDAARTPPKGEANGTHSGPKRVPDGSPARVLDETRQDEQRKDEPSMRDEPHLEAWLMVKHRPPTDAQQSFLDRYLLVFDKTGPQRMAQLILKNPLDPIAALKRDLDEFRQKRLSEIESDGSRDSRRGVEATQRYLREQRGISQPEPIGEIAARLVGKREPA